MQKSNVWEIRGGGKRPPLVGVCFLRKRLYKLLQHDQKSSSASSSPSSSSSGPSSPSCSAGVRRFLPEQRQHYNHALWELHNRLDTSDWARYLIPTPQDVRDQAGRESDSFRIASPGEGFRYITLPRTEDGIHLRTWYLVVLAPLMQRVREGTTLANVLGEEAASGVIKSLEFFGTLAELVGDKQLAGLC
eukprot:g47645.t1